MTISDKMKSEGVKALLQCDDETLLTILPSRLHTYEQTVVRVFEAMQQQVLEEIHASMLNTIQLQKKE